jgi:hypothetical protein
MSDNIKNNNTTADLQPIILIAESDETELQRIRKHIDRQFHRGIKTANNYGELLAKIDVERPHLVLLGRIDTSDYITLSKASHQIEAELPIFLLSKQSIISDSFSRLVKNCGLNDVIVQESTQINEVIRIICKLPIQQSESSHQPIESIPSESDITGEMILASLEEIVGISNNFFGNLAQGNYWRKSHAKHLEEHPFLLSWSADHFSKISCDDSILLRVLTDEEIKVIKIWIDTFLAECDRIILNFRQILQQSNLSPFTQEILTVS